MLISKNKHIIIHSLKTNFELGCLYIILLFRSNTLELGLFLWLKTTNTSSFNSFSKTDTCFVSKLKLYGLILSLFYSCEINCCRNVSVKYITLVELELVMLLLHCKSQLFLIISLRIELHKNCSNSSYIRSICFPKRTTLK